MYWMKYLDYDRNFINSKIYAIKIIYMVLKTGLKEAKDIVDDHIIYNFPTRYSEADVYRLISDLMTKGIILETNFDVYARPVVFEEKELSEYPFEDPVFIKEEIKSLWKKYVDTDMLEYLKTACCIQEAFINNKK